MLSKKRALLRAKGSKINTTIIIGKGGISESLIDQTRNTINANELIKCKVLDTAFISAKEAAESVALSIGAEIVCTIGNKFVLYKKKDKVRNKKVVKVKPKRVIKLVRKKREHNKKSRNNYI